MYRYQPPKANIWGHRLRNMPAVLAKQRFAAFLAAAVADYRFVNAHLVIPSWIARALADAKICKLNESRLKLVKERAHNPTALNSKIGRKAT